MAKKLSKKAIAAIADDMGAEMSKSKRSKRATPKKKVRVTLNAAQEIMRKNNLAKNVEQIEILLVRATGKTKEWLRSSDVRPTRRDEWYWVYSGPRAPKSVETWLYSRGFRRHSQKDAYVHSGTCQSRGWGDETKHGSANLAS